MIIKNKIRLTVWTGVVTLILIMLVATQFVWFTNEVQWNETATYSIILLVIGGVYELWQWLKTRDTRYRMALSLGLLGLFLLGWVSGAVGIIGSENNFVNLMYWVVPLIFLIGSVVSRFRERGMAYTLFTVATIQFLIPAAALVLSPEVSWGDAGVFGVFILNFFFVLMFFLSGVLFVTDNQKDESFIGYQ